MPRLRSSRPTRLPAWHVLLAAALLAVGLMGPALAAPAADGAVAREGAAPGVAASIRVPADPAASPFLLAEADQPPAQTPTEPTQTPTEPTQTPTEPTDDLPPIPDRTGLTHACPDGEFPRELFDDVADEPFGAAIDCLAWYEITLGVGPGEFQPAGEVTRGQMAMFLSRLIEYTVTLSGEQLPAWDGTSRFDDVRATTAAAEAVNVLSSPEIEELLGIQIVAGGTDGRFRPQAPVSREQMGTFLARTLRGVAQFAFAQRGLEGDPIIRGECPPFPDAEDISAAHADNVDLACEFGITAGRADGTYGPDLDVTREQMAAFLMRTQDVFVEFELSMTPTARTDLDLPDPQPNPAPNPAPDPEPEPDPVLGACRAEGLLVEVLRIEPSTGLSVVDVEVAGRLTVVADATPDIEPRVRVELLDERGRPYEGSLTSGRRIATLGDGTPRLTPGSVIDWEVVPFPVALDDPAPVSLRVELTDLLLEGQCDFEVALDLTP